jgi:uncharacterized protein YndB with AHSA1/START domain
MNEGTLDGNRDDVLVERTVELDAPTAAVWTALTDDRALSEWFGGPVTLEPVPGGAGRFDDGGGEVREARVDEVDTGRKLSFRWWPEDDANGPITTVTFELTEVGGVTRLVVTERALLVGPARAQLSAALDRRWTRALGALALVTASLVCA